MTTEKINLENENSVLNKSVVACRYYNSGVIGIVGVHVDNIKHQDGDHTFLTGRSYEYQWIRTEDLYNTYEEAKNAPVALFYNRS